MNFSQAIESHITVNTKHNIRLFATYFILFLFIYGSMIVKHAYVSDELQMFEGPGYEWLRAIGRWGIAIWRVLFGTGSNAFVQGITAGALLAFSLILLTNSIHIKNSYEKVAFGCIYLIQCQFAYAMEYSFQVDAVAFGLICAAGASIAVQKKSWMAFFAAISLLTISIATYQSIILNYCIVIAVLLFSTMQKGDYRGAISIFFKGVLCCICAYITYLISWKLATSIVYTAPDTIQIAKSYLADFNVTAKIGYGNITGLLGESIHIFIELLKSLIFPQHYECAWIYSTAIIPIVQLITSAARSNHPTIVKVASILCILSIYILPYTLMLVFLNPEALPERNQLSTPLSLAALWVLFLPTIQWKPWKLYLFTSFFVILAINAANSVNSFANRRRAEFESRLIAHKQMEIEAVRRASMANIPICRENILIFMSYGTSHGHWNPMLYYPAQIFSQKDPVDVTDFKQDLDEMEVWPAEDSIRVSKGKVIVKMSYSSYLEKR